MAPAPPSFDAPSSDRDPVEQQTPVVVSWTDLRGAHRVTLRGKGSLGSAQGNVIIVSDRAVSPVHASIDSNSGEVWICDRNGNGTFVNNVQVIEARLPIPIEVRCGSTVLRIDHSVGADDSRRFGPLVGAAPVMVELFRRLRRAAASDASVLIQAETGSGKELVARTIHEASPRARGPFVVVDCAALPTSLLEAELFGHARGAFSGASAAREGVIEAAHGGTVFFDEVGELPLHMQPKLLRVLEARTVRRIGETKYRNVDVRFICATHRDLAAMVADGSFREDLHFRLAVLTVRVPSLRERMSDLDALLAHFSPASRVAITRAQRAQLESYQWPGNVRELRNFVERVHALGVDDAIATLVANGPAMANPSLDASPPAPRGLLVGRDTPALSAEVPFRALRRLWSDWFEREYVRALLSQSNRSISDAAAIAELDRTYVYKLVRKHGL